MCQPLIFNQGHIQRQFLWYTSNSCKEWWCLGPILALEIIFFIFMLLCLDIFLGSDLHLVKVWKVLWNRQNKIWFNVLFFYRKVLQSRKKDTVRKSCKLCKPYWLKTRHSSLLCVKRQVLQRLWFHYFQYFLRL